MFPRSTIVRYKFPAREDMPEVNLTWWDGGMMPARPRASSRAAAWATRTAGSS